MCNKEHSFFSKKKKKKKKPNYAFFLGVCGFISLLAR